MAVYFRHGSNGAYKTAYAVWFEIVPALRSGRLVVTNIEGMKPLKEIEEILDEKFPVGAQLVRLFSRDEEQVVLWQNWFSWMPTGALVIIDECQDIFSSDVGFKREKTQRQPLESFLPLLPDGFEQLFYERWTKVDLDLLESGDEDDSGRTQLDDQGRLLYPHNFYGAFMRHRKYQWDIIMLTPDWTSIPTWLRGCAQEAYSHRSTDTFFRKRKPRIFNHRPNSTKTAPTTKLDHASCSTKKIPIDVFALYKSTGTGGFNESKADISILKSPKLILAALLFLGSGSFFISELMHVLNKEEKSVEEQIEATQSSTDKNQGVHSNGVAVSVGETQNGQGDSGRVANGDDSDEDSGQTTFGTVNVFKRHFPDFNQATGIYLTSIEKRRFHDLRGFYNYHFRIDMQDGSYYLGSKVLSHLGYSFDYIDYCFVRVRYENQAKILTCPPNAQGSTLSKVDSSQRESVVAGRTVDLFNLSDNL